MSTTAPIDPNAPAAAPTPGFEEMLRKFWEKNAKTVYLLCALVLLVIVGKGAFEYYQGWREDGIGAEFAAASTDEKLKAFAGAHPDHALGGAANLSLADGAYRSGKYAEAAGLYQKAAETLKQGPLAARAVLGAGVAKISAGLSAEGEEKLKLVANDAKQLKPARAEAAYHLGALAADAGRFEEAAKYFDQASSLEPSGIWARRAMMQRATLTLPPVAEVAPAASGISLPSK